MSNASSISPDYNRTSSLDFFNSSYFESNYSGSNSSEIGFVQFQTPYIQIVAIGSVLLVAVVVCLRLLRYTRHKRKLSRIPRHVMPVLRPGDISSHQRHRILTELLRCKGIVNRPSLPLEEERAPGLYGWGHPGTPLARVHFKTSVSKSYMLLERAACQVSSSLARPSAYDIRSYVTFLEDQLPQLDRDLTRVYVSKYETAKFGPDELSENDFTIFMEDFGRLLQQIEDIANEKQHYKSS